MGTMCGERALQLPREGSMHATSPMWFCSFEEGLDLSLSGDALHQAGQSYDGNQKSEVFRDALVFHREVCSGTGPS